MQNGLLNAEFLVVCQNIKLDYAHETHVSHLRITMMYIITVNCSLRISMRISLEMS